MQKEKNSKKNEIDELILKYEPDFIALINLVRQYILAIDKEISEEIKWNSPSFFYNGDMKAFNPKEYKRDIVVMNLRKNTLLLIFPTGNVIEDKYHILEGNFEDGRRMITVNSIEEFKEKETGLKQFIENWLSKVEK